MLSTIGIVIDIIIVAALVIFSTIGFFKGFLKSFLSLFSWMICIIVACLVAKYVAGWINGIYNFSSLIGRNISNNFANMNDMFKQPISAFADKNDIINNIPAGTNGFLVQLIKMVFSNSNIDMTSSQTVAQVIGLGLGNICMVIISAILVFILLKILIALLSRFFDNITKIKVLGVLNKVLGLIFGFIKAAFMILLFNVILAMLTMLPVVNKTVSPLVQKNTYVEKFIYNQTEKVIGKHVIEGKLLQNWITGMWNNR